MSGVVRAAAIGAQGPTSPAFRVRTAIAAHALLEQGVEILSLPLFDARGDERFRRGAPATKAVEMLRAQHSLRRRLSALPADVGVALIQRQADLLPSLRLERLACHDRRVVLDVDDAIWLDSSRDAHGHALAFVKGTERKLHWLARRADHVIAGNETIAGWFAPLTASVSVVPSMVDTATVAVRLHAATDVVRLGWIGSPSTAPHLHQLAAVLERVARNSADVRFELDVVGGPAPRVPGLRVRELPWSVGVERDTLGRMDIGLMPLPDNDWTRAKCAHKALLYMAAGIPVVADPVGVTAAVVGHELGGLLPANRQEWCDTLVALGRDVDLRQRLGTRGRRRIEADYSVARWAPQLARILRG